jgi:hypothetical protein
MEMQKFIGVKLINAMPMTVGDARNEHNVVVKFDGSDDEEGYLVEYPDGFKSWCPSKQFEEANRPSDFMSFGFAIEAAKKGARIARKGWNGKNMFVYLVEGTTIPVELCRGACAEAVAAAGALPGASQDIGSHLDMMAADGKIVVGWLASQTDILADDWEIVD